MRVLHLGNESFSYDEVIMLTITRGEAQPMLHAAVWGRPPVIMFLGYGFLKLFGISEVVARMPSALMGIGSLVLIYKVGKQLLNERVALYATLLLATSTLHIFYSQDFRYYSALTFFTLLSYLFFTQALESNARRDYIGWIISAILVYYSHTHGAFVLFAQGVYFLLTASHYRANWWNWFTSQLGILAGISYGLFIIVYETLGYTYNSSTGVTAHLKLPTIRQPLYDMAVTYVAQGLTRSEITRYLGIGAILLVIITTVYVYRIGIQSWMTTIRHAVSDIWPTISEKRRTLLLLALWVFCPLFLPVFFSRVLGPMYLVRYTLGALPAFYLLIAFGLDYLHRAVPDLALVALLLPLAVVNLTLYYIEDTKGQWAEIASYVEQNAQPDDAILYIAVNNEPAVRVSNAFNYYTDINLDTCGSLEIEYPTAEDAQDAITDCAQSSSRIWLISRPINDETMDPIFELFGLPENEQLRLIDSHEYLKTGAYLLETK